MRRVSWIDQRRSSTIEDARIEAVIVRTLETKLPKATHWSSRSMARASGLSVSTVQRIWRTFGLQPHRLATYKLSNDPNFVAKVRDVVGLYVVPPERAICCVSTKSHRSWRQIGANPRSACVLVRWNAAVTTTSAMARHRYLRL